MDTAPENTDQIDTDVEVETDAAAERRLGRSGIALLFGVLVLVMVAAFLLTFVLRGGLDQSDPQPASVQVEEFANLPADPNTPATAPVFVDGAALPPFDVQSAADPAVGQPFPYLSGVTFSNKPLEIPNDGRPKVVVFFAHYSAIADRFVSDLGQWLDANDLAEGVDIYAVSTKADPEKGNFPPGTWLRMNGWPYLSSTLVDSETSEAFAASGGPGVPFFVVVGADGTVVGRTVGNLTSGAFNQLTVAAQTGVFDAATLERIPTQ